MSAYELTEYGAMIADAVRLERYTAAMRRYIGPHTTVLDLGTGTGIHALLACRLGAERVFAVEVGDAVQVAREIARDNGFADRITFLHEASTRVSLPGRVDLIVSDLRGVLPMFGRHLPAIADARERLLAPGGTIIPARDELWAAPVDAPDAYGEVVGPWQLDDLDMSAARRLATHSLYRKRIEAGALLAPARSWGAIDYDRLTGPDVEGGFEATVERPGTMHGIAAWFDGTLADGVEISNAPGAPPLIYGQAFFPLPEPIEVSAGDIVGALLHADLVADDYVWRWHTELTRAGANEPELRLRQSTFLGAPLSPRTLAEGAASHVPVLGPEAAIDLEALALIDGTRTLRDIAERLARRHPDAFADASEALDRVAVLARRHAR